MYYEHNLAYKYYASYKTNPKRKKLVSSMSIIKDTSIMAKTIRHSYIRKFLISGILELHTNNYLVIITRHESCVYPIKCKTYLLQRISTFLRTEYPQSHRVRESVM